MTLVKANKDTEAGVLPSTELLAEMGKYNEEMVKAGVLLAAETKREEDYGQRIPRQPAANQQRGRQKQASHDQALAC